MATEDQQERKRERAQAKTLQEMEAAGVDLHIPLPNPHEPGIAALIDKSRTTRIDNEPTRQDDPVSRDPDTALNEEILRLRKERDHARAASARWRIVAEELAAKTQLAEAQRDRAIYKVVSDSMGYLQHWHPDQEGPYNLDE